MKLRKEEMVALVAWDGKSRGVNDASAHFLEEPKNSNLTIKEISTL